jgi:hypothetical protein
MVEIDRMKGEVQASGNPIDRHILNTRLGSVKLPDSYPVTTDTFFYQMIVFCRQMYHDWNSRIEHLATHGRQEVPGLMDVELPESIDFIQDGEIIQLNTIKAGERILKLYGSLMGKGRYPRGKRFAEMRRVQSGEVNRKIVEALLDQPRYHEILVAIYQDRYRNNERDTILFQIPLKAGELSVMDLFLNTLRRLDMAGEPSIESSRDF